jgi:hypothetical protein
VEFGTIWTGGQKIFAAVHQNTPRGVRVVLEGSSYGAWIVGCADPETVGQTVMASLTGHRPGSPGE